MYTLMIKSGKQVIIRLDFSTIKQARDTANTLVLGRGTSVYTVQIKSMQTAELVYSEETR